MSREYENLRQLWDTRWTPVTDEVVAMIEAARREAGGTYRALAVAVGIKSRQIRRIARQEQKGVSLTLMDKILSRSGQAHKMHHLEWLTPDQMVSAGHWNVPKNWGSPRAVGDDDDTEEEDDE